MNTAVVRHCLWREYRMGRGFWLSMLVLTLGIQLSWHLGNQFGNWNSSPQTVRTMALVMPLIYVLGWAATSFNREHETGSFALLNGLPLTSLPIWVAKLGFTLISGLLLGAVLATTTAWHVGLPRINDRWVWVLFWMLWLVAIAGIGAVCSQWIKRPMTAVFVSGSGLTAAYIAIALDTRSPTDFLKGVYHFIPLIVGLLAFAISLPQTRPWLQDRMKWSLLRQSGSSAPRLTAGSQSGERRTQLQRLLWISWRRLGALYLIPFIVLLLSIFVFGTVPAFHNLAYRIFGIPLTILLAAWPVLLGTTLFYCEQDTSHARFLVGQGVSPKRLWWSRQLIGTAIFVAISIAIMILGGLGLLLHVLGWKGDEFLTLFHSYWWYAVLAYLAGQLMSVTFRSRLIGHAAATLMAIAVAIWSLFCNMLGIPVWIGLVIPASGLLLASRLRFRPWLLEWNSARHWLAPGAAFVGGLVASAVAFATFRATEIPWVGVPFDIARFTQLADTRFRPADAQRILSAGAALSSHRWREAPRYEGLTRGQVLATRNLSLDEGEFIAWASLPAPIVVEEQAALADAREILTPELEQALESADGLFSSAHWKETTGSDQLHVSRLANLFVARARQRQADGDMSAAGDDYRNALKIGLQLRRGGRVSSWITAWQLEKLVTDNLIFWAASSGQDSEKVTLMIDGLVHLWRQDPAWATPLQVDYIVQSRLIDELPDSLSLFHDSLDSETATVVSFVASRPSEKARLRRLLNIETSQELAGVYGSVHRALMGWDVESSKMSEHWRRTTPLSFLLATDSTRFVHLIGEQQLNRTALILRLLMIEHHWRVGEYPRTVPDNRIPPEIEAQADEYLHGFTILSSSSWIEVPILARFQYRPLTRPTEQERFVMFAEPLGSFVADAEESLAIVVGDVHVYPLPNDTGLILKQEPNNETESEAPF